MRCTLNLIGMPEKPKGSGIKILCIDGGGTRLLAFKKIAGHAAALQEMMLLSFLDTAFPKIRKKFHQIYVSNTFNQTL